MLKLNPNPTFDTKVQITVPGQEKPESFTVTFRYLPKKALQDYFKRHQEERGQDGEVVREASTDAVMLGEIIVGWSGIDAEYNADNLSALLENYHTAPREIIDGYVKAVAESRVKN